MRRRAALFFTSLAVVLTSQGSPDPPASCSHARFIARHSATPVALPTMALRGGGKRKRITRDHKIGPDVLDYTGVKAIPHDNTPRLSVYMEKKKKKVGSFAAAINREFPRDEVKAMRMMRKMGFYESLINPKDDPEEDEEEKGRYLDYRKTSSQPMLTDGTAESSDSDDSDSPSQQVGLQIRNGEVEFNPVAEDRSQSATESEVVRRTAGLLPPTDEHVGVDGLVNFTSMLLHPSEEEVEEAGKEGAGAGPEHHDLHDIQLEEARRDVMEALESEEVQSEVETEQAVQDEHRDRSSFTTTHSLPSFYRSTERESDDSETEESAGTRKSSKEGRTSDEDLKSSDESTDGEEPTILSSDFSYRPKPPWLREKRKNKYDSRDVLDPLENFEWGTEKVPKHLLPPDPRMWRRKKKDRMRTEMMREQKTDWNQEIEDMDIRSEIKKDWIDSDPEKDKRQEKAALKERRNVLFHDPKLDKMRAYVRKKFNREEITIYRMIGNKIIEDDFDFHRLVTRDRERREFKRAQKEVAGSISSSVEDFDNVAHSTKYNFLGFDDFVQRYVGGEFEMHHLPKSVIRKFFPPFRGATYAILRDRQDRRDEWEQTAEARLFNSPDDANLPEFVGDLPITNDIVQNIEESFKTQDGEYDLDKMALALEKELKKINKAIFRLRFNKGRNKKEADSEIVDEKDDVYASQERLLFQDLDRLVQARSFMEKSLSEIEQAKQEESIVEKPILNITYDAVWILGFDVNPYGRPFDKFFWTPAVQYNFWSLVKKGEKDINKLQYLMDMGAVVNAHNPSNAFSTALHLAAWGGHVETCRNLLLLGANVTARRLCGSTALHLSAFWGHFKERRGVRGVEVHAARSEEWAEIDQSRLVMEVTRLLVEKGGADMWCKRPYDRKLPLDVAASENNKWVDRTRVVVWLRRKMGLEEKLHVCKIPKRLRVSERNEYVRIPPGPYIPPWQVEDEIAFSSPSHRYQDPETAGRHPKSMQSRPTRPSQCSNAAAL
ncbi:hypothetical protein GUITHDRAFT_144626 [Guillardia theta CCMP2712]|uniref:Uncharacterized protein n=2 Tax=Guillardia theta TaxID=55529 RepID=L1INS7_GUITC|nr:hypothetical protein GUITHDRAFT_144626 [Guillardia theta CCMP2712]EKX37941.1 hypothetical protein GUITHDRAFT_144626 [Guillardia theta CCMP2712]|eukprot:XP_005824921.1 hypothetical protein GUITHDRAFT_144626 [Guillardia theta CCMP2712]